MYVWMFAVDEHGRVGQRLVKPGSRPFVRIDEDQDKIVGYAFRVDPWWREIMPGTRVPVTEARLEAWQDAGILVDPNRR